MIPQLSIAKTYSTSDIEALYLIGRWEKGNSVLYFDTQHHFIVFDKYNDIVPFHDRLYYDLPSWEDYDKDKYNGQLLIKTYIECPFNMEYDGSGDNYYLKIKAAYNSSDWAKCPNFIIGTWVWKSRYR